ncbi:hypothetical protein LINPERPRIM_LOCUS2536 [Linum perenne]
MLRRNSSLLDCTLPIYIRINSILVCVWLVACILARLSSMHEV